MSQDRQHVLVVGGGPAGMAAALTAAQGGAQVTLLERRPAPGKKLLATGNGRCNLANRGPLCYPGGGEFAGAVFKHCPVSRVLEALRGWGLTLYTDGDGRVYPAIMQATAVLSALTERLEERRVRVLTGRDVSGIARAADGFDVTAADGGRYRADRLILATGGLAGGALGSRRTDYALAEGLGHTVTALMPALSALKTSARSREGLSGLRLPALLTLKADGRAVMSALGEALFTDDGVSGICAMQLSREAGLRLARGERVALSIDLSDLLFPGPRDYGLRPPQDRPDTKRALAFIKKRAQTMDPSHVLTGILPDRLAARWKDLPPLEQARRITDLTLDVTGVRPMEQAQVTAGGVRVSEVDPARMASLRVKGLYLCGELLDVDGDCGGFNLQFAFASGMLAGTAAASKG